MAIMPGLVMAQANVTLTWNPITSPLVAGFKIYFGEASGVYTNDINAGLNTSVTITNLVRGSTYYFAATTYSAAGAESALSSEVTYTVPLNPPSLPPTLDPIGNVALAQNSGSQTVNLTGISAGITNGNPVVTVTASSSNPNVVPNPAVSYTNPANSGSLQFTPVANATGSATITVTVNNGAATNNLVTRSFVVSVGLVTQQIQVAAGGQVVLTLNGPVGSNYVIQTSTDLVHWTPFSTNTISPAGSVQIADLNPNSPQKFYRSVPYNVGSVQQPNVGVTPASPQLSAFTTTNGVTSFMLTGPAGSNYVAQSSTDLANWSAFSTNTIPAGGSVNIFDPAPASAQKFYRVIPYAFSLPPLHLLSGTTLGKGVLSFVLRGPVGSNYVIQTSTDLVNWTPFSTNTISPAGSDQIVDLSPKAPQKFYRAVPYNTSSGQQANVGVRTITPQLSAVTTSNGVSSFVLTGPAGSNYVVQASADLVNWTPISTNTIPASGSVDIFDSTSGAGQKFYRVVPYNLSIPLPPQLSALHLSQGIFSFVLKGPVGSNYVIQASTDLAHWVPISTNTIPSGGSVSVIDAGASSPQKFYRAVP